MPNTQREQVILRYFQAWVQNDCQALDEIFTPLADYTECYGPQYLGIHQIKDWFVQWHSTSRPVSWTAQQFFHDGNTTICKWNFVCVRDGATVKSDGASIIVFNEQTRIMMLQEFLTGSPGEIR